MRSGDSLTVERYHNGGGIGDGKQMGAREAGRIVNEQPGGSLSLLCRGCG